MGDRAGESLLLILLVARGRRTFLPLERREDPYSQGLLLEGMDQPLPP